MKIILRIGFLLLLAVPAVAADTFTESFESYNLLGVSPQTTPDQNWYDYSEDVAIGEVSISNPVVNGAQWMHFFSANGTDTHQGQFALEVPATLSNLTFVVNATPYSGNGGSRQVISVESSAPTRTMVQFYVLCNFPSNISSCEFRVRFDQIDSTGQVLINTSASQTKFNVTIIPDWLDGDYNLYVNGVNDGTFPFLEIPDDIGRVRISQQRSDVPMNVSFDDFTVVGTVAGDGSTVDQDVVTGLRNFATDIRFSSSGSKFFLGFIFFCILCASVLVPILALGLDNTVIPAIGFFAITVVLWMIFIEFWPDWIGIGLIVGVGALVGTITRKLFLGIQDASSGAGLVAGSLGYFIISASLLAFSGYATDTITVPTGPAEQQDVNETTNPQQSFIGAVAECVFTGGVFTFGLRGDCSQDTVSKTWTQITDVFGWVRTGLDFLFQLLTFQLPIPVIFNVIIVLPPAAALATFAIMVIRGLPS